MSANDLQRATPQAVEAEQSVIGALLGDNDAIDRVGGLRVEHFYRGDHRAIYAEITGLLAQGVGADALTVFERLDGKGRAAEVGGLRYLNELANQTPGSSNIGRYAEIVRDRWVKRSMIATASEIQDSVGTSPEPANVLLDRVASKLELLAAGQERKEPVRLSVAMSEHLSVMERRMEGKETILSTGLMDLDRALGGGFRAGQNIVLAARPGMGKTALALNIALAVAQSGFSLFLSMEMQSSEIVDRSTAQLGRIPLQDVTNSSKDNAFWESVTVAASKIGELGLFVDDQGGLTLLDIRNKARAIKRKHGLNLLVVDYLQLMSGDGENRNEQIGVISRGLKALAKELGIAVLTLSQLNRKSEDRTNKMPQQSDLRDSGSIEQDADIIIFIHREEVSNPDCSEEWRGFAQVRIAKIRNGRPQDIGLNYAGEWVTFQDRRGPWPSKSEAPARRGRGFEG